MTDAAVPVVNTGYDGFGGDGNWLLWIVVLFALFSGNGFGWGNRGGEAFATNADLQRGFDTNTIINKLDGITNGICDSSYALNNSIKDGIYANQSAIAGLGSQLSNCCCDINRHIDAVRYENAQNTCSIINNATANTQRILDKLCENEINNLRTDLQSAQLQISQLSQTSNIVNSLRPTPIPAYITCSPYQAQVFGCGFNNSCGCC